jgi:hypothetical protein
LGKRDLCHLVAFSVPYLRGHHRHGKLAEKRLLVLLESALLDCLIDSLTEEECVDGLLEAEVEAEAEAEVEAGLELADFCGDRETGGSTCSRYV